MGLKCTACGTFWPASPGLIPVEVPKAERRPGRLFDKFRPVAAWCFMLPDRLKGRTNLTYGTDTVEFTREEIVEQLHEAAHGLGMTVEEMLRAFREDRLEKRSDVLDALTLFDILPESDPLRKE